VPVVPTAAAYQDAGWRPSPSELDEIVAHARQSGLTAINFWNWDYAGSASGGDLWNVIAAAKVTLTSPRPVSAEPVKDLFDALNQSDLDAILGLYQPDGALITATSVFVGINQIAAYYTNLLTNLLPGGNFAIASKASEQDVWHVAWNGTSVSATRTIRGAQDTISLKEGRIQTHTSLY
jgi:hypothetical protein